MENVYLMEYKQLLLKKYNESKARIQTEKKERLSFLVMKTLDSIVSAAEDGRNYVRMRRALLKEPHNVELEFVAEMKKKDLSVLFEDEHIVISFTVQIE